MIHGINVQMTSNRVLCWIVVGNNKLLSLNVDLFIAILKELPKINSNNKKLTIITIRIKKYIKS
jgi:hypothetical protein